MAPAVADAFFILTQKRPPNFTGSIRQKGEPFPEATPEEAGAGICGRQRGRVLCGVGVYVSRWGALQQSLLTPPYWICHTTSPFSVAL